MPSWSSGGLLIAILRKLNNMTFADQLKKERQRLRLTQAEAAGVLDTPARTYWEYEAGKTTPPAPYQEGALARLKSTKAKR